MTARWSPRPGCLLRSAQTARSSSRTRRSCQNLWSVKMEIHVLLQLVEVGHHSKYLMKRLTISECLWYGELLCNGAVVQVIYVQLKYFCSSPVITLYIIQSVPFQDLYRWWFLSKCSKSKMSVVSRSWLDVTSDKRYKPNQV